MANAAGGRYHAPQQAQQSQYSSYIPGGGQYYPQAQQQPHQQMGYQYYGQQHQPPNIFQPQPPAMGFLSRPPAPPPPPPPPPGETTSLATSTSTSITTSASQLPTTSVPYSHGHVQHIQGSVTAGGGYIAPLQPPPLPPMFPWMSPALAESMRSSRYGKSFEEEASNLPFVPIIVNDADLAKMTENVVKEAEEFNSQSLQYYKDVMKLDLPKSLKDMFQPLYCKLCVLSLSSPVVAKDHYNGKRHKKSVDAWLGKNPHFSSKHPINKINEPLPAASGNSSGAPGLINGFITKHQIKHDAFGSSTKPSHLPPLMQTNVQKEPPPSNFDRKRPAPPPPPPPQNQVQQHEQSANFSKTLPPLAPSQSSASNYNNDSRARGGGGPPFNSQHNQGSWQMKGNESGNGNQDFPQPKRPRRDEPSTPVINNPKSQGMCDICNVQLTSPAQADQHFKGKNHAAKVAALEEQGGSGTGTAGVLRIDLNAGGNSNQNIQRPQGASPGIPNHNNRPFDKGPQKPSFQRGGGGGRGGGPSPQYNQNRGNNKNNRGMNKNNRFNNNRGKWS